MMTDASGEARSARPTSETGGPTHISDWPEGNAIVYCEGAFGSTNGKTAHGLVRRSRRYRLLSIVDSQHAGSDAGQVLDGRRVGIPIHDSISEAYRWTVERGLDPTHLVVGLAPDGGRLKLSERADIQWAIELGLNVDSGLHDSLGQDPGLARIARERGVTIRDVRRPPPVEELHFFCGKISEVSSFKVAVLGTDSAVGKRTTAWMLVDALSDAGCGAELVGTGQTAWLQGSRYGIILDSLVNDFVAGEIEHAVWSAWAESSPEVIVIEGQGSLMNPAYPGGYEILAAGRPDAVVLQHAPARIEYDGFPGHPLHPLERQIQAIELISDRPVVAITLNHEGISASHIDAVCRSIADETGLPVFDTLVHGAAGLAKVVRDLADHRSGGGNG
jgi:uncharacterized NAD-dependent epimerase/dehydratase family protein